MARVTLPACLVEKRNADGSCRYYWQPSAALRRAGFATLRLADDLGAASAQARARNAEVQAWREGREAAPVAGPAADQRDTIAALIDHFENHADFAARPANTQAAYRSAYRLLRATVGSRPWRSLTPVQVRTMKRAIARERPALAELVMGAGAALYQHGALTREGFGFRPGQSPFHRQGGGYSPARAPQIWSAAQRDQVMRAAEILGWPSFAAMTLANYWLGQRPGDITRLTRADLQDGVLRFIVQKTRTAAVLPVHVIAPVETAIAAELARQDARNGAPIEAGALFVNERTGRAWTDAQREQAFRKIRALATEGSPAHGLAPMPACAGLWFRELRHTTVVALAEAGVDQLGIAAITRHSLRSIARMLEKHYLVATEKQAANALRKRLQAG